MLRFRTVFAGAQIAALAVAFASLVMWPGAPVLSSLAGLAFVWLVVAAVYRSCRWRSQAGWWTLLAAITLLSVGFAINVNYFTEASGGTVGNPVLHNVDSARAWAAAMYELGLPGGEYLNTMRGYGTFVSWQMCLFGVSIAVPLVFNVLFVLLTIVFTGGVAWRACADSRVAAVAMVMTASVCYFLVSGVILLKDATVCLVMAMAAYSLLGLREFTLKKICVVDWLVLAVAVGVLYLVRGNYLPYVCIMAALVLPWRRNCTLAVMTVIVVAATVVVWRLSFWLGGFASPAAEVVACDAKASMFNVLPQHRAYAAILGDYPTLAWWQKVLRLPMSACVQYFIPFPWSFVRDTVFGPSQAYAHVAYPWYAVGGCMIYYVIYCIRRCGRPVLDRMLLAGLLLCVFTAYITGGTVSRYCLPMLPALVPAAAYAVVECRKNKSFKVFSAVYVAAVVVALLVARNLQLSAI